MKKRLKALQNKYLPAVLIFLIVGTSASAQSKTTLPVDTFPVPASLSAYTFIVSKADTLYVWSPTVKHWVKSGGGGGASYTNGFGIASILSNTIKADTSWSGLQTKADATRRLDSIRVATLLNAITNQNASAENKSFWLQNTGRVDEFFGVNASQFTTEKFRVSGNSRLEGDLSIIGGNFFVSGTNSPALYFDNNSGVSARFMATIGQVRMGSYSSHPVEFVVNGHTVIRLVQGTNTLQFPLLGTTQPPQAISPNSPVNALSIDANGNVFNNYDFWPRYKDSINGNFSFELDPMMYAAYDPSDPTKIDTLGVYHVDTLNQHGLGIIDSIDYRNLYRAYNGYVLSGTFSTGTITFTRNDGSTFQVTGLSSAYTDEQAQDAIASLIAAGTHTGISFSYNDASNLINATVSLASFSTTNLSEGTNLYFTNARVNTQINTYTGDVTFSGGVSTIGASKILESMLGLTDITTANVSTTKHGFVKKLDNNAAHYYDGTGNWSTPPGGFTNTGTVAWSDSKKVMVHDTTTDVYGQVQMTSIDMSTFTANGQFVKWDSTNNKFISGTPAGGSGESNTASNLGGGLANFNGKVGVDLQFNSFAASDFDLASNVISIDATLKSTWNGKQAALSGTGFVKISGTTISYDNSTYTPTSRTITINGTALDLSANRTWTIAASDLLPSYTGNDGKVLGLVAGSLAWVSFSTYNLPSLTQGSVIFKGASDLSQDNANFFYDATNHRLGLGTTAPTHTLTFATGKDFVLYNSVDQTTNYERLRTFFTSNVATIKTEQGGTGVGRNIALATASGTTFTVSNDPSINGFYQFNAGTSTITTSIVGITPSSLGASNGLQNILYVGGTIAQSGTAGYRALYINPTESSVGTAQKFLIEAAVGSATKFRVDNTGNVLGAGFATPTGTSAQFLKANGTVDNNSYQLLDADLTSLASASSTGVLYYRSGANTWNTVIIGDNLSFSGGTLSGSGYTLPTASTSILGGVMVDGTSITINSGVISATQVPYATNYVTGSTSQTVFITTAPEAAVYKIGTVLRINSISSASVTLTLTWTDVHGSAQSKAIRATDNTLSWTTTGIVLIPNIEIACQSGTSVQMQISLSGTASYDVGVDLSKVYSISL